MCILRWLAYPFCRILSYLFPFLASFFACYGVSQWVVRGNCVFPLGISRPPLSSIDVCSQQFIPGSRISAESIAPPLYSALPHRSARQVPAAATQQMPLPSRLVCSISAWTESATDRHGYRHGQQRQSPCPHWNLCGRQRAQQ